MASLPTEWSYNTAVGPGGQAIIVIPAPGPLVRRKITHITAEAIAFGSPGNTTTLQVQDGGFGGTALLTWTIAVYAASGVVDRESFDEDVIEIGSPGAAMAIAFLTAAPAGNYQQILVRGENL